MTYNSRRRNIALKLWISKQGFSASGLGVHQGQRNEWAGGMQKALDLKGSSTKDRTWEKQSKMKKHGVARGA